MSKFDPIEQESELQQEESLSLDYRRLVPNMVLAGKYRLDHILGQGGMGVAWKAYTLVADMPVCLKILINANPSSTQVLRLQQESRALARLNHPNIVKVHALSHSAGAIMLVTEFVEGLTLDKLIAQQGALPAKRAVGILRQLASALDHAHKHGVVHRDLKPANVMVCTSGTTDVVKLLDFGLASLTTETNTPLNITVPGSVFGTPAYMSPEQCAGGKADARSDIYSFGCLMYELLTGAPAFSGSTAYEMAAKHMNPGSVDYTPLVPEPYLTRVVSRCLALEPSDRYQSAEMLEEDLLHWDSPVAGRSVAAVATKRRGKLLSWIALSSLLLLAVAPALIAWSSAFELGCCSELFLAGGRKRLSAQKLPLHIWTEAILLIPELGLVGARFANPGFGRTVTRLLAYGLLAELDERSSEQRAGPLLKQKNQDCARGSRILELAESLHIADPVLDAARFEWESSGLSGAGKNETFSDYLASLRRIIAADRAVGSVVVMDVLSDFESDRALSRFFWRWYALLELPPNFVAPVAEKLVAVQSTSYGWKMFLCAFMGENYLRYGDQVRAAALYEKVRQMAALAPENDDLASFGISQYALFEAGRLMPNAAADLRMVIARAKRSRSSNVRVLLSGPSCYLRAAEAVMVDYAQPERVKKADEYYRAALKDLGAGIINRTRLKLSYGGFKILCGDLVQGRRLLDEASASKESEQFRSGNSGDAQNIQCQIVCYQTIAILFDDAAFDSKSVFEENMKLLPGYLSVGRLNAATIYHAMFHRLVDLGRPEYANLLVLHYFREKDYTPDACLLFNILVNHEQGELNHTRQWAAELMKSGHANAEVIDSYYVPGVQKSLTDKQFTEVIRLSKEWCDALGKKPQGPWAKALIYAAKGDAQAELGQTEDATVSLQSAQNAAEISLRAARPEAAKWVRAQLSHIEKSLDELRKRKTDSRGIEREKAGVSAKLKSSSER